MKKNLLFFLSALLMLNTLGCDDSESDDYRDCADKGNFVGIITNNILSAQKDDNATHKKGFCLLEERCVKIIGTENDVACSAYSEGFLKCGENEIDARSDNNNCGTCGNICKSNEQCQMGICTSATTCNDNELRCNEDKKTLEICNQNSWSTKDTCSYKCENKACVEDQTVQTCNDNELRCNEDNKTLEICNQNSWSTKDICAESCQDKQCICSDSKQQCNGSCVDYNNDVNNCGSCGNKCTDGNNKCVNGTCTKKDPGDSCEVDSECLNNNCAHKVCTPKENEDCTESVCISNILYDCSKITHKYYVTDCSFNEYDSGGTVCAIRASDKAGECVGRGYCSDKTEGTEFKACYFDNDDHPGSALRKCEMTTEGKLEDFYSGPDFDSKRECDVN